MTDNPPFIEPPPVEEPSEYGTCKWYVSIEEEECGKRAVTDILVRTPTGEMLVPLCTEHKSVHNSRAAEIRKRGRKVPYLVKGGRTEV